jgi:hypothetical protein
MSLRVIGPFIDKASFTLPIDDDHAEYLGSIFRDFAIESGEPTFRVAHIRYHDGAPYNWRFRITIYGSREVDIELFLGPHDPSRNPCRIELNPHLFDDSHAEGLGNVFGLIFHDLETQ